MRRFLDIPDELRNFLRHLPPQLKDKIKRALVDIVENPSVGKPLRDDLISLNSYQVGKMRIIYRLGNSTIILVAIGPRKTIYQKMALEIKHSLQN